MMARLGQATVTTHWRPTECSLTRESFNDIVTKKKSNVPAILQRTSTMSRSAMLIVGRRTPWGAAIAADTWELPAKDQAQVPPVSVSIMDSKEDGFGSIRLGTPTLNRPGSRPTLDATPASTVRSLSRSSSLPVIRPTPHARYGYMPPGAGRLLQSPVGDPSPLSRALTAKVEELFGSMDIDSSGYIERNEAVRFFRKFQAVSADAMFDEVDEDNNGFITLQEFKRFWEEVLRSGYTEEDMLQELNNLQSGEAWVKYRDSDEVDDGTSEVSSVHVNSRSIRLLPRRT
mmetsp:Transcript_105004/g.208754  ORF Transcript_105004/g.208754 Transcript_105004/m.208754 type:complete len:287 (-) Transcript_105004:99-959(-)